MLITVQLICVFVFSYAKSRFSHDTVQVIKDHDCISKNLSENKNQKQVDDNVQQSRENDNTQTRGKNSTKKIDHDHGKKFV